MLEARRQLSLEAGWKNDFEFEVRTATHLVECGLVKKMVAREPVWEVRINSIVSNIEHVATAQLRYSLPLAGAEAIALITEGTRRLGHTGRVTIFAMDGLLLLC
jgi:hypothetical protein